MAILGGGAPLLEYIARLLECLGAHQKIFGTESTIIYYMHPERLHALVVDREPRVRSTVKSALSAIGYRVKETGDARDAVSIVDRQPCLDLLVTEAQPLNFDGRTLADRYLTICPLGRVIMMSRSGEVDAINAESTGGWIFLPRERVGEMLLPALKDLVYRKRRIVMPDSCC